MTEPATLPLVLITITGLSTTVRLLRTARWRRASAEVVSLGQPYSTGDTRVDATMVPVIRFSTIDGQIVTLQDDRLALGPALEGERIAILYSPLDPRKVVAASPIKRFRIEFILLCCGGTLLLAGALS